MAPVIYNIVSSKAYLLRQLTVQAERSPNLKEKRVMSRCLVCSVTERLQYPSSIIALGIESSATVNGATDIAGVWKKEAALLSSLTLCDDCQITALRGKLRKEWKNLRKGLFSLAIFYGFLIFLFLPDLLRSLTGGKGYEMRYIIFIFILFSGLFIMINPFLLLTLWQILQYRRVYYKLIKGGILSSSKFSTILKESAKYLLERNGPEYFQSIDPTLDPDGALAFIRGLGKQFRFTIIGSGTTDRKSVV